MMNVHYPAICIGNQTALSATELMLPFNYAVEHGFDAFEWFPDRNSSGAGWDLMDLDEETRTHMRNISRSRQMRLSVHAPLYANLLNEQPPRSLVAAFRFAQEVEARLVNIHLYPERGIDAYIAAIAPLISQLAEFRISISIENTPLTTPHHFNEFFGRLNELRPEGFERVGMCLDLGHANLCHITRNHYLRYIDLLGREVPIIHVHLHENWGDADTHLPVFTGPAGTDDAGMRGFIERLLDRDFSGSMILEQWPQPPALLDRAREKLSRLLAESRDLRARMGSGTSRLKANAAPRAGASRTGEDVRRGCES